MITLQCLHMDTDDSSVKVMSFFSPAAKLSN